MASEKKHAKIIAGTYDFGCELKDALVAHLGSKCVNVEGLEFGMASQESGSVAHSAELIGNAFVEQYYHILHQSPGLVYHFYQDSSVMGRPDPNGVMTLVSTIHDINEKIMSLDYHKCKAEIKTVDSQDSFNGGVVVVVTGSLLGKGSSSSKFVQSFFLAPQDKGYYVLNDVFRTMDETEAHDDGLTLTNSVREISPEAPLTPEKKVTEVQDHNTSNSATQPLEELNNVEEVTATTDHEERSVVEEVDAAGDVGNAAANELQPSVEPPTLVQEEPVKKSYASIVKDMKESTGGAPVSVPATVQPSRANTEWQYVPPPMPVPLPPSESSPPSNDSSPDKADGCSIYIRNLPMNATEVHLEDVLTKFGPIKPGGIQVRSSKQQGFCYGFVEFETSAAVQDALETSPIIIGGRQCFVEVKRATSTARGDGRGGRFPAGRGEFRSDGPRGRGNFGGRGYGRGEIGNARGWGGSSGRGGDGSQRGDQNGNGRASRYATASYSV